MLARRTTPCLRRLAAAALAVAGVVGRGGALGGSEVDTGRRHRRLLWIWSPYLSRSRPLNPLSLCVSSCACLPMMDARGHGRRCSWFCSRVCLCPCLKLGRRHSPLLRRVFQCRLEAAKAAVPRMEKWMERRPWLEQELRPCTLSSEDSERACYLVMSWMEALMSKRGEERRWSGCCAANALFGGQRARLNSGGGVHFIQGPPAALLPLPLPSASTPRTCILHDSCVQHLRFILSSSPHPILTSQPRKHALLPRHRQEEGHVRLLTCSITILLHLRSTSTTMHALVLAVPITDPIATPPRSLLKLLIFPIPNPLRHRWPPHSRLWARRAHPLCLKQQRPTPTRRLRQLPPPRARWGCKE